MKRYMPLIVALLVIASVAIAATNYVNDGSAVVLTWSTTSPSANDPVIKCAAKATGGLVGVALNGAGTAGEYVTVRTKGIFKLSVTATGAPMNVGDYVFAAVGGIEVCTATLSNDNTGLCYGQLLEAVSSGATSIVQVKLLQPSHL